MATISSSETFAKRRAIFLSVRRTVNIQGYSKLREPIKTREIAIHWFGKYQYWLLLLLEPNYLLEKSFLVELPILVPSTCFSFYIHTAPCKKFSPMGLPRNICDSTGNLFDGGLLCLISCLLKHVAAVEVTRGTLFSFGISTFSKWAGWWLNEQPSLGSWQHILSFSI